MTKFVVVNEIQVAFPRGTGREAFKTPNGSATCEKASPGCPQALLRRCLHATPAVDNSTKTELCEGRQGAESPGMVFRPRP